MKMTLPEGIEHLKEVIPTIECEKCREEHEQLLEWLEELLMLREKEGKRLAWLCKFLPHKWNYLKNGLYQCKRCKTVSLGANRDKKGW